MLALVGCAVIATAVAWAAAPSVASERFRPILVQARSRSVAGDFAGAESVLANALAHSPDSPELLDGVASVQQDRGDYLATEKSYRKALAMCPGGNALVRARVLNDLATLYIETAQQSKLESLARELEALPFEEIEKIPSDAANILSTLAAIKRGKGEFESAERFYLQSIDVWTRTENGKAVVAYVTTSLANMMNERGRSDRATELFHRAIDGMNATVGPNHAMLIRPLYGLATSQFEAGDVRAAESTVARAVEISRRAMGDNHPTTAAMISLQADVYRKLGRKREAGTLKREADAIRRETSARNLSEHDRRSSPVAQEARLSAPVFGPRVPVIRGPCRPAIDSS